MSSKTNTKVIVSADPKMYLVPEEHKDTVMRAILANCTTRLLLRTDTQETKAE